MVFYDNIIKAQATAADAAKAIAASVEKGEQFVTVKPDTLLIVLGRSFGYIFLLRPQDGSTQIRLIADTSSAIRSAFKGTTAKEALNTLLDQQIELPEEYDIAAQRLNAIKAASERSGHPLETFKSSGEVAWTDDDIILDTALPAAQVKSTSREPVPWSPDQIFGFIFFMTTVGVGIGLGWNWRRLGKPQWTLPTILITILLPVIFVLTLIVSAPNITGLGSAIFIFVAFLNFSFILALWYIQRGGYKKWQETHSLASLEGYRYNFGVGIAVSLLIVTGVAALVGVSAYLSSRPHTFENADVKIVYSSGWVAADLATVADCENDNFECIMAVHDSQFGYTLILLGKYSLATPMDAAELEMRSRDALIQQLDAKFLEADKLEIDGLPAARRFYDLPGTNGDRVYIMQIYVVNGKFAYEITVQSANYGIFRERRNQIDAFIAGIDFRPADQASI